MSTCFLLALLAFLMALLNESDSDGSEGEGIAFYLYFTSATLFAIPELAADMYVLRMLNQSKKGTSPSGQSASRPNGEAGRPRSYDLCFFLLGILFLWFLVFIIIVVTVCSVIVPLVKSCTSSALATVMGINGACAAVEGTIGCVYAPLLLYFIRRCIGAWAPFDSAFDAKNYHPNLYRYLIGLVSFFVTAQACALVAMQAKRPDTAHVVNYEVLFAAVVFVGIPLGIRYILLRRQLWSNTQPSKWHDPWDLLEGTSHWSCSDGFDVANFISCTGEVAEIGTRRRTSHSTTEPKRAALAAMPAFWITLVRLNRHQVFRKVPG